MAILACSPPPKPVDPCVDGGCVQDAGGGGIDSCAAAGTLTTAPLLANTTTGISTYTSECGGGGNDLLFRVTLTERQDVMLVASPIDRGMPIVALLEKPCTPGALTTLACGDGTAFAYDVAPGEYYVLLDSPVGEGGPSEVNLLLTAPTPPPPNDACAHAQELVFVNGRASASGDTRPATDGKDAGCAARAGRDVVYRYTLDQPRDVTITLRPDSAWRPAVYVTASCEGPEVACSAPASGPVTLTIPNQAAGTWFVWVDGTDRGAGHPSAGGFTLVVVQ